MADARVTLASLQESADPAVLDAIARDPALEGTTTASRALSNALLAHLARREGQSGASGDQVDAWMRVSEARTLTRAWPEQGTILRQAVDLALRTGQWERGWSYAHEQLAEPSVGRNERVAVLAKGALLAWHRKMLPSARDLGEQARLSSVAVDHPWVRTYAYFGGVVAAAAGAGSVEHALSAYADCVTTAGHETRPHRAWAAAQVALDAGHPVRDLRKFLEKTVPGILGDGASAAPRDLRALTHVMFADAVSSQHPPDALHRLDMIALDAHVAARVRMAEARWYRRAERLTAATSALGEAASLLRDWPGRLSEQLAREYELSVPAVSASPAQERVMTLLAEGWSNAKIAEQLGLSERTVAVHVRALLHRNRARGRTELAARYLRHRLQAQASATSDTAPRG